MKTIRQTDTFRAWESRLKDKRVRAAIAARAFRLAHGLTGDVEPVGEGISELRIHLGPGYRLTFIQEGDQIVILLCGGSKRRQEEDIRTAKRLAKEIRGGEPR